MNWRQVWALTLGQDPGVEYLHPLVASLLLYTIAFVICFTLYSISRHVFPNSLKLYLLDFFKTLLVCVYPYGHGLVRSVAGHVGYCLVAVPLVLFTVRIFKEGSTSPLAVFEDYIDKKLSLAKTLLRIVIQTAAGFASFRLVQLIWMMEFHADHVSQLRALECQTDLKVPLLTGFLIETVAVLYDTWLSHQHIFRLKLIDDAVKTLNGTVLVCLGVQLTGMYMHPAMASGLTFGCKGTSAWEHVFVYWLGGFLGCYGAIVLNRTVTFDLVGLPKKVHTNGHYGKTHKSQINNNNYITQNGIEKRAVKNGTNSRYKKKSKKKN